MLFFKPFLKREKGQKCPYIMRKDKKCPPFIIGVIYALVLLERVKNALVLLEMVKNALVLSVRANINLHINNNKNSN